MPWKTNAWSNLGTLLFTRAPYFVYSTTVDHRRFLLLEANGHIHRLWIFQLKIRFILYFESLRYIELNVILHFLIQVGGIFC